MVRRVRNIRELYGFHFADVSLEFPDYNKTELDTVVVLRHARCRSTSTNTGAEHKTISKRYGRLCRYTTKSRPYEAIARRPNILMLCKIKFGYAVTCHKAQGGQWAHIYLDQGYMTDEMLTTDYIHWLYTAFTRATEHLYLVNWNKEQIAE